MQHTIILVTSVLLTGAAMAAPSTTTPSPSPSEPPPTFDGAPLGPSTVAAIHAAAGEVAPLVAWSACREDGSPLDHCLTLTVSAGSNIRSYVLTDLRCPLSATATACYGGYVVGVATATRMRAVVSGGAIDVEQTTGMRFGVTVLLWPATTYAMPATDDFTMVGNAHFSGGSKRFAWTLKDRAGTELASDGLSVDAASSLTCEEVGKGARDVATWVGGIAADGVGSGIAAGGILTGIDAAGIGTVSSAGLAALPSIGVGLTIAAFGLTAGNAARTVVLDEVERRANLIEFAAREGCEWMEAVDDFQPQDIDLEGDPRGHQDAGGGAGESCDVDTVKCDGRWEGGVCYDDGTETYAECEQHWAGGECTWFCVETCLSGC